jgi:hypothetical protein
MSLGGVIAPKPLIYVDPRDYGAKADAWVFNDGTIVSGNLSQVVLTHSGFQASAVTAGNSITLRGAGSGGADLVTTIASFVAPSTINIAEPAAGALANVSGIFGTDDAGAINLALAANGFQSPFQPNGQFPTIPNNSGVDGWWQFMGRRVVLASGGARNTSLFGVLSPIRMTSGAILDFQTDVAALGGFNGQAVVHQIVNGSGFGVLVTRAVLIRPRVLCDRNAANGVWIENASECAIDGDGYVRGATSNPFKLGPDAQEVSGSRCIVTAVNGRLVVENFSSSGTFQNSASSIGVYMTAFATDNSFCCDVDCVGYRTGYQDNGGNNTVGGELHVWTGANQGYMTSGVVLNGGGFDIRNIFIDSPLAGEGAGSPTLPMPCYGVVINAPGNIGTIGSTVNLDVGTLDDSITLVKFNYAGTSGGVTIGSIHSNSAAGVNFANIVDASAGNVDLLTIGSIQGDGRWYNVGYVTPVADLQAQITTNNNDLVAEIDAINEVLPGAPWTPTQIIGNLGAWFDANDSASITLNGSSQVTSWRSRAGAAVANTAASSTSPLYSATGWESALPAVTFNGLINGDMLDFGQSVNYGQDVAIFMVAERGTQESSNTTTVRTMINLNTGNGSDSMQPNFGFNAPAAEPGQTHIRFATVGNNSADVAALPVGQSAIIEGFFTLNYVPVGATGIGTFGSVFNAGTQSNSATESIVYTQPFDDSTLGGSLAAADPAARAAFTCAEVIVYVGVLSNFTRQQIEGYLAWKWFGDGAAVLPSNHPYFSAGPTITPALTSYQGLEVLLFSMQTANMNSTADQQFSANGSLVGKVNSYLITKIRAVNSSAGVDLTSAEGGIYTATAKGGTAIVGATQTFTGLTAANLGEDLTLTSAGLGVFSGFSAPYLSLTDPQGVAATAAFYIFGVPLS